MPKFCRTPGCQNYNQELRDDQVDLSPDRGVYYCKQCLMDTEVTPDAGSTKPPIPSSGTQGKPVLLRPAPSSGSKEDSATLRPTVSPPTAPVRPQKLTVHAEEVKRGIKPEIAIKGSLSFPVLELWREGDKLGEVSVKGDEFLIGRPSTSRDIHPDLDLSWIPEAKQISREHALIYQDEGNYFVKDLGSKNGTYLNDAKLDARTPYPLKEGDRITLGDGTYGIIFHWQGG